jgi:hypothetical protein
MKGYFKEDRKGKSKDSCKGNLKGCLNGSLKEMLKGYKNRDKQYWKIATVLCLLPYRILPKIVLGKIGTGRSQFSSIVYLYFYIPSTFPSNYHLSIPSNSPYNCPWTFPSDLP